MDNYRMPWDLVILRALHEGREKELRDIYENIEQYSFDINSKLLDVEPKWGNRPKYQHTVRSTISNLIKNGKIERLGRGQYIITNDGKEYLRLTEFPIE